MQFERKVSLRSTKKCSNHESPPEQLKSYLAGRNVTQQQWLGLVTWKAMQRTAWEDLTNWLLKKQSNCTKSQLHAWTTITSKKEELETTVELPKVSFSNRPELFCIWPELVDFYMFWPVNKLARVVIKWTRACDKRLARLISYVHHTCDDDDTD